MGWGEALGVTRWFSVFGFRIKDMALRLGKAKQLFLSENPEAGTVIPGSGGCRKLRWAGKGKVKGKRGDNRVIYFLRPKRGQVVLVAAYAKNERDDIPREWLRRVRENFDGQSS